MVCPLKRYLLAIVVVVLYLITLLTLPSVDYVEPDIFFYFKNLPLTYHLATIASIIIALFGKQRITKILSACVLSLLLIWTPSLMLVQPWHLDSYPFVAQAVYVAKNGHLGDFHYLLDSPALGLTFAPYLLITGINPLTLLKIYPFLCAIFLVLLVYSIARNLKMENRASIAAVFLSSVLWPFIFHFSRWSFSLAYYLISLSLLCRLVFKGADRRFLVLLIIQMIFLVLSHPATPLYFIFNVACIFFLGKFLKIFSSREYRLFTSILAISSIAWLLWNIVGTHPDVVYLLRDVINTVVTSILGGTEVAGIERIDAARTPSYGFVIDSRLIMMLFVAATSLLMPFLIRHAKKRTALFLIGWLWSNLLTLIPIFFVGLSWFQKPIFFSYVSWAIVAATLVFQEAPRSKRSKAINSILIAFIFVAAAIIPFTKYGPLPLAYPTTRELVSKEFLDLHRVDDMTFVYFVEPAYFHAYISYGIRLEAKSIYIFDIYESNQGLNRSIINMSPLWITSRILVYDVVRGYSPSLQAVIENATQLYPTTTHNKVYDCGWPEYILIPRS